MKGRDGGQVVSVLAFYSEFESRWNLQFCSVKFVIEKNENNQKEAWVGPFLKKTISYGRRDKGVCSIHRGHVILRQQETFFFFVCLDFFDLYLSLKSFVWWDDKAEARLIQGLFN